MGRRWALACGTVLVMAAPAAVEGQVRTCDFVQAADYAQLTNERGEAVIYFRDPVRMQCTGGVTLSADSAVVIRAPAAPSFELIGSVFYQDSVRELTSEWANYLGATGQLMARGRVVLTDRLDGSVVTGEELQYRRQTPERPTSHVLIRGGRPHAVLREGPRPAGGGAPAADTAAPLDVTADRLEFVGDSLFLARGRVELERGAIAGTADSARYHQLGGRMTLLGRAHVEDPTYRLEGERIDARLEGEALREVRAENRARLVSEELTVRSRWLRIGFVDGALDRLEAWGPPEGTVRPADGGGERAVALAEGFRLLADSIDARADAGRLREVRAVGRGYGEQRLDSLAVGVAPLVARDWIQGDTIIGHFRDVPAAGAPEAPDGAEAPDRAEAADVAEAANQAGASGVTETADTTAVELERVIVIGGSAPALSLYRIDEETGERPAINFMSADRITLFMAAGEVSRVEAEGPIEGVYLDPVTGRPGGARAAGGGPRP